MPVLRKFQTFAAMDSPERQLLAHAALLPLFIALSFRLLGVSKTQGRLRQWAMRGARSTSEADEFRFIRRALNAQRLVKSKTGIEGSCLVKSLTLWAILLKGGLHADLRVGMRKREGKLGGHAWLEYRGRPLNEDEGEIASYSVYDSPVAFDITRPISK